MKYLLNNKRLTFMFRYPHIECYNYGYDYSYQINGILFLAIMDLASKIIEQQKIKSIILKKRKPIIHLLNYVDMLNFNGNVYKFGIAFSFKNTFKDNYIELTYNLCLYRSSYRRRYYDDFYNNLKVIERKNLCIIKFEGDYDSEIQPKNLNLAAMLIHILEKKKIDMIDVNVIIFYCVFLM